MTDEERRAHNRARGQAYRLTHADKCRASAAAYRAAHKKVPPPMPTVKVCAHCAVEKPRAAFAIRYHPTGARPNRGALGVDRICKACRSHLRKPTLAAERAHQIALAAAHLKTCNVCRATKPYADFAKRRASTDGLSHTCRACANARTARFREAHPTHHAEWYERNRTEKAAYWAKWRERNVDRVQANYRQWATDNADRVRAISAQRNAAKVQATPPWVDPDALRAVYREAIRLTRETGIRYDVDHIVPLRSRFVCGLHVPWNLQLLPRAENLRKGNAFRPHTVRPQAPSDAAGR